MDADRIYKDTIKNLKNLVKIKTQEKKEMTNNGQENSLEFMALSNEIKTLNHCLLELLVFMDG